MRKAFTLIAVPIFRAIVTRRTLQTDIDGFRLTVSPGVFHPRFFVSSLLLSRYALTLKLEGVKVLDMGTGSGVLGVFAASRGADVTAIDISPVAVECARDNFLKLGMGSRVKVLRSDLFAEVPEPESWSLIFWNPPFFPRDPSDLEDAAWNAGDGYRAIRRFARDAPRYLSVDGAMYLVFSSDMDIPLVLDFFSEFGFGATRVLSRRALWETFHIFKFTRR